MTPRNGRATIFALASAPGSAGIAVWRVSGPEAVRAFGALCAPDGRALPEPRRMTRVAIRSAAGEPIDDGFAAWFPAPASFTGEDVLELYLHGGRAVVRAVAAALGAVAGLRLAKPGEFTRRAVEAGKMDLTRAEGIADLVAAETDAQLRQSRRQMEGALGALYAGWRVEILGILARYEAGIDFPDEEVPDTIFAATRPRIEELRAAMTAHLADNHRGERIRDGVRVAIAGAPNVGKSSLINAIARRDVAIVSHRPGTTRDVVEVTLDLGGYPVVLADTAGLRETADDVESEGVRRARAWAENADLILRVVDAEVLAGLDREQTRHFITHERTIADTARALLVVNKIDAFPAARGTMPASDFETLFVSAKTGEGLDRLLATLTRCLETLGGGEEAAPISRARHRTGVTAATAALSRARDETEVELAAENLRDSARALGEITGEIGVEQVLDAIFREFCIGK